MYVRWKDILAKQPPAKPKLYPFSVALHHYARAIAFAVLGQVEEAKSSRNTFIEMKAAVPPSHTLFNNSCTDILAIAAKLLEVGY